MSYGDGKVLLGEKVELNGYQKKPGRQFGGDYGVLDKATKSQPLSGSNEAKPQTQSRTGRSGAPVCLDEDQGPDGAHEG